MSNYLIELSVVHVTVILGYWFFLRKEHQYARMRAYLIGSTLLALFIPLLKLPNLLFSSQETIDTAAIGAIPLDAMAIAPAVDTSGWNYGLLVWIYVAITAFFLFKFLAGLFYLIWLERKSSVENFGDLHIRKVGGIKGSFTFFTWIFLSDEIQAHQREYEMILKHEKAHASLGHTYDLIFFELFKVCFWWLPTAWFIMKEIKKIHEYQADACALKSCDVDQYTSILISSTLKANGLSLASSFHEGLILKRLKAMKQQAKKMSPWKLGALSALCALLIIVFACSEEPARDVNNNSTESSKGQADNVRIVEAQPEFDGGAEAFYRLILNEMRYPKEAREKGVEGRVDVEFVVDKDGSLTDVRAIKGIGAGCDEEAVRVVKSIPPFKPGKQNGKPVRVRMVVPIIFKLNEGKTNPDNTTQGIIVVDQVQSKNENFKVDADYANGEWSGTVYDEQGERLPGVNVVIFGTTRGTVSDINGVFKVRADESNDLVLSFIGYESVRLKGRE